MFYNGETIKRGKRSQDRALDKKVGVLEPNWRIAKSKGVWQQNQRGVAKRGFTALTVCTNSSDKLLLDALAAPVKWKRRMSSGVLGMEALKEEVSSGWSSGGIIRLVNDAKQRTMGESINGWTPDMLTMAPEEDGLEDRS
jgi:hypothetical protein